MLAVRIALRYLFSRKSHAAVNVISLVSTVGVAIAAAAIVVILSVFNGFAELAASKLSRLDPDLLVSPVAGKTIADADVVAARLRGVEGIAAAYPVIREQAFAIAGNRQQPVTILGLPPEAASADGIADATIDGRAAVDSLAGFPSAIVSVGVAMNMSVRPYLGQTIGIYEPRRTGRINPANPFTAFTADTLMVGGVFQVEQAEYDVDFVILPLATVRQLLDYDTEASAIQLWLRPGASTSAVAKRIGPLLGPGYRVADRLQQQEQAFRIIAIEKWITFAMLAFILVIASFNIISAISMLIVEKDANMGVLLAMGATRRSVARIFMVQAWLITVVGGVVGIAVGAALSLAQQHFGFVRLHASNTALLATDVYPVRLLWPDLLLVLAAIAAVATLISLAVGAISRRR